MGEKIRKNGEGREEMGRKKRRRNEKEKKNK
jgi:hypothetical protein